jgi:ubiquitin-like protein Pup
MEQQRVDPKKTKAKPDEAPVKLKRDLVGELDDLLAEIDEALEENALEVIRTYVQKSGQ